MSRSGESADLRLRCLLMYQRMNSELFRYAIGMFSKNFAAASASAILKGAERADDGRDERGASAPAIVWSRPTKHTLCCESWKVRSSMAFPNKGWENSQNSLSYMVQGGLICRYFRTKVTSFKNTNYMVGWFFSKRQLYVQLSCIRASELTPGSCYVLPDIHGIAHVHVFVRLKVLVYPND